MEKKNFYGVDRKLILQKLYNRILEIHANTPEGEEPIAPYKIAEEFIDDRDSGIQTSDRLAFRDLFTDRSGDMTRLHRPKDGSPPFQKPYRNWDDVLELYQENNRDIEEAFKEGTIDRGWNEVDGVSDKYHGKTNEDKGRGR